jgi:hypothetical protein
MQTTESTPLLKALRRTLAVGEFAVAGLFLLMALDGFTTGRVGGGCGASYGAAFVKFFALPSLLIGVGVAAVAFKGWRSGRRWWAWHAAMLAWVVVAPIGSLILLAELGG